MNLENNSLNDQNKHNQSFFNAFRFLNKLTELNLSHNKLGDKSAKQLLSNLIQSKAPLYKLILSHNNISFESGEQLCNLLIVASELKVFNISYNLFGSIGIALISPGLQANTSISELELGHNGLGGNGCKFLIKALEYNQSLIYLGLSGNCIGEDGYKWVNNLLLMSTEIKEIDLQYNECRGKGLNNMESFLRNNITLKTINLSGNKIRFNSSIDFFQELYANSSITALILKDNNLDYKTIYAILNESIKSTSIISLDLSYNHFNEQSCKSMFEYLRFNKIIIDIDLSHCKIGNGLNYIAEGLKLNSSVKCIKLNGNSLPSQSIKYLISCLYYNCTLSSLFLVDNHIDDSSIVDLAKFLIGAQTMISQIDLCNNNIGMKGANCLLEAIKITPLLTHVNLERNQIGNCLLTAIQTALSINQTNNCN